MLFVLFFTQQYFSSIILSLLHHGSDGPGHIESTRNVGQEQKCMVGSWQIEQFNDEERA